VSFKIKIERRNKIMSSNSEHNHEKIAGIINTAVGGVKEEVGKSNGDTGMVVEGAAQKAKGRAQQFSAAVQNVVQKGKDLLGMKDNS
jgi:uncharacterized protein YjbJ (UPF0337 family)